MSNYRVPTIDEFIQGFEFEVRQNYSFGFLTEEGFKELDSYIAWRPYKVTWKDKESTLWDKPFDEKVLLENGIIRVKI